MLLLFVLIFLANTNLILADEGASETIPKDLLPKKERRVFIDKIARRILEEAELGAGESKADSEDSEAEVKDLEFIHRVIREESENLRRKVGDKKGKKGNNVETALRTSVDDKKVIDLTVDEIPPKNRRSAIIQEDDDAKTEEDVVDIEKVPKEDATTTTKAVNTTTTDKQGKTTDKYSVEVEIIDDKNVQMSQIPVQVIYDDVETYYVIETTTKPTVSAKNIETTTAGSSSITEVQSRNKLENSNETTTETVIDLKNKGSIIQIEEESAGTTLKTDTNENYSNSTSENSETNEKNSNSTSEKIETKFKKLIETTTQPNSSLQNTTADDSSSATSVKITLNVSESSIKKSKTDGKDSGKVSVQEKKEQINSKQDVKHETPGKNEEGFNKQLVETKTDTEYLASVHPNTEVKSGTQKRYRRDNDKNDNLQNKSDIQDDSVEHETVKNDNLEQVSKPEENDKILEIENKAKLNTAIITATEVETAEDKTSITLAKTEEASEENVKENQDEQTVKDTSTLAKTDEVSEENVDVNKDEQTAKDTTSSTLAETEEVSKANVKENKDEKTANDTTPSTLVKSEEVSEANVKENKDEKTVKDTTTLAKTDEVSDPNVKENKDEQKAKDITSSRLATTEKVSEANAKENKDKQTAKDTTSSTLVNTEVSEGSKIEEVIDKNDGYLSTENKTNSIILVEGKEEIETHEHIALGSNLNATKLEDTPIRNDVKPVPVLADRSKETDLELNMTNFNDATSKYDVHISTENKSSLVNITSKHNFDTAAVQNKPNSIILVDDQEEIKDQTASISNLNATELYYQYHNSNEHIEYISTTEKVKLMTEIYDGDTSVEHKGHPIILVGSKEVETVNPTELSSNSNTDSSFANGSKLAILESRGSSVEKSTFEPNVTITTEEIVKARTEFITGKYDTDISEENKANGIIAILESRGSSVEKSTFEPNVTITTEEIVKARTEFITGKYDTDISEENKANGITIVDGKEEIDIANNKDRHVKATAAIYEPIDVTSEPSLAKDIYPVVTGLVKEHSEREKNKEKENKGITSKQRDEFTIKNTETSVNVSPVPGLDLITAKHSLLSKHTQSTKNFVPNIESHAAFDLKDKNSIEDNGSKEDDIILTTTPLPYLTTTSDPNSIPALLYAPIGKPEIMNEKKEIRGSSSKIIPVEVYEISPDDNPFNLVKQLPRVKLMDVKDQDLKPKPLAVSSVKLPPKVKFMIGRDKDYVPVKTSSPATVRKLETENRSGQTLEEPRFVPVYNYARENAYFNPSNKYRPASESQEKGSKDLGREGQGQDATHETIEQTNFAPVYNYAAKNAYYNPANRYRASSHAEDESDENNSETIKNVDNDTQSFLTEHRPKQQFHEYSILDKQENDEAPTIKTGRNEELYSFFKEEEAKEALLRKGVERNLDDEIEDAYYDAVYGEEPSIPKKGNQIDSPQLNAKQSKTVADLNLTPTIRLTIEASSPLSNKKVRKSKEKRIVYIKNLINAAKNRNYRDPNRNSKDNDEQRLVSDVNKRPTLLLEKIIKAASYDNVNESDKVKVLSLSDKDTRKELKEKLERVYGTNNLQTKRQFDDRPYPMRANDAESDSETTSKPKRSKSESKQERPKKRKNHNKKVTKGINKVTRRPKAKKVKVKSQEADTDDARESLDFDDDADTVKRPSLRDRPTVEYAWYSDPADVSSGDADALKTLNIDAIELILNLTDTDHIYPILRQLNQLYVNDTEIPGFNRRKINIDDGIEPYVQVLGDKIRMDYDNRALTNYNWLATTVDIRSALHKIVDLSKRLLSDRYIHPKDLQIIKFVIYLFKSSDSYVLQSQKDLRRSSGKVLRQFSGLIPDRPWLARSIDKKLLRDFGEFWLDVEALLNDLHDAIKHIASVTKFKKQRWFTNLKELYLNENSRKQTLEVLLHLTTSNFVDLLEIATKNGLDENYVTYAMDYRDDMLKMKKEFEFLLSVYNKLKKEVDN